MRKTFQNPWLLVALLTMGGAALRFYDLGYKSLWLDEAVIYWNAQGTLEDVIHQNATSNSAPPTFTLLVRAISKLNRSEFTLRLIPCIAGILVIPASFLLVKRFSGSAVACAVSLLFTLAPQQIHYAQELREYSMTVLVALLIVYFGHRITVENKNSNFVFYSIVCGLAFFVQYGLAFVVAAVSVIFVAEVLRTKQYAKMRPFTLSLIAPALSVLFVYNISLKYHLLGGARGEGGYLQNTYWNGLWSALPSYLIFNSESIVRFTYDAETKTLLLALVLLGVYACLRHHRIYPLAFAVVLFGISMALGLIGRYPYYGCRQTIYLVIPVFLLTAVGLSYLLQSRRTKPFFYIVLVLFSVYGLKQWFKYVHTESIQNIEPIAAILNEELLETDRIYVSLGSEPAFRYYFQPLCDRLIYPLQFYSSHGISDPRTRAEFVANQPGRIFLMFTHYKSEEIDAMLNALSPTRDVQLLTPPDDYVKLYLVTNKI